MTEQQLIQKILSRRSDCFSEIVVPRPRRIQLHVDRDHIAECASHLKNNLSFEFISASGIENEDCFNVIYYLLHSESDIKISLHTRAPKDDPFFNSLAAVFSGSQWAEKEISTLYRLHFIGNTPEVKMNKDTLDIYESVYDLDAEGML